MHTLLNCWSNNFQTVLAYSSHNVENTGQASCDLGSNIKVKICIFCFSFLVFPPRMQLDVATAILQVHRSHDVEGTW